MNKTTSSYYADKYACIFISMLLLMVCQTSFSLLAQTDSIQAILKKDITDQKKVEVLSELPIKITNSSKSEHEVLSDLLNFALEVNSKKLTTKAYHHFGVFYFRLNNYDSAEHYFRKTVEWSVDDIGAELVARSYGALGNIEGKRGNYEAKLKLLDQALSLLPDDKEFITVRVSLLSDKGNLFKSQNKDSKAIACYKEVIELQSDIDDANLKAYSNINLGVYYVQKGGEDIKYVDSAEQFLNRGLTFALETNDPRTIGYAYRSLGVVGSFKPDSYFDTYSAYFNKAIQHYEQGENAIELGVTKYQKALLYAAKNKLDSAVQLLTDLLSTDSELLFPQLRLGIYKQLDDVYSKQREYEKALVSYKIYEQLKDSIQGVEQQIKIEEIEAKYQLSEKNAKINELNFKKDLAEKRRNELVYIVIILILIMAVLGLVFSVRLKRLFHRITAEKRLHKLKERELELELNKESQKVLQQSILVSKKNEFINDLKELTRLGRNGEASQTLQKMYHKLKAHLNHESSWQQFDVLMGETDQEFIRKIKTMLPSVTPHELRLLSLVKLGFRNKEISDLFGIQPNSVKVSKFRLKKKLFPDDKSGHSLYEVLESI